MLTKANPDNKTLADDPVVLVAVHVPDEEAVKPVLQPVEAQTVDEVHVLQFDGHAVVHVGAAVAKPEAHNKQLDVELDNQQFVTPVPDTYEPLAYKTYEAAGPPVQAVPFAAHAVTTPAAETVYPAEAVIQVDVPGVNAAHPTTVATHAPGHDPTVAHVDADGTQVYPVAIQLQHEAATEAAVGVAVAEAAVKPEAHPSPIVVDVRAPAETA